MDTHLLLNDHDLFVVFDMRAALMFYDELSRLPLDETSPELQATKRIMADYTGIERLWC